VSSARIDLQPILADWSDSVNDVLWTPDVRTLRESILHTHRERLVAGAETPTMVVILGIAGGGKSKAAGWLCRLLTIKLGGDPKLVRVVEDDNYLYDKKGIRGWFLGFFFPLYQGWIQNYDFERIRLEIFERAKSGKAITYLEKNWATQKYNGSVTIEGAEIILLVGRFPRKMIADYVHYVVWVKTPRIKAVWRGLRRSLEGKWQEKHFLHILYWLIWWLKDLQYTWRERPHEQAHAVLNRDQLQDEPAELLATAYN
jgi:hypothetical protein